MANLYSLPQGLSLQQRYDAVLTSLCANDYMGLHAAIRNLHAQAKAKAEGKYKSVFPEITNFKNNVFAFARDHRAKDKDGKEKKNAYDFRVYFRYQTMVASGFPIDKTSIEGMKGRKDFFLRHVVEDFEELERLRARMKILEQRVARGESVDEINRAWEAAQKSKSKAQGKKRKLKEEDDDEETVYLCGKYLGEATGHKAQKLDGEIEGVEDGVVIEHDSSTGADDDGFEEAAMKVLEELEHREKVDESEECEESEEE